MNTNQISLGVGDVPITREMINTLSQSLDNFRDKVCNVRYGRPGTIMFEFDGHTYSAREPADVMPAVDRIGTNREASRSWALKQILSGKASRV